MTDPAPILVVTGLSAEARIAAGPGCRIVAGGGDSGALALRLASQDPISFSAVVSFGVAGGLEPGLPVGAVVIATEVRCEGQLDPPPAGERPLPVANLVERLARSGHVARLGPVAGVDRPAATAAAKRHLYDRTGALAVDMESHVAAAYAARRGVPFLAIRVVSDGADHAIPAAAAAAMRPDGSVDVLGMLAALAREPGQIPGLIATAWNAAVAFRVLRRVRRLLGSGFGLHL